MKWKKLYYKQLPSSKGIQSWIETNKKSLPLVAWTRYLTRFGPIAKKWFS